MVDVYPKRPTDFGVPMTSRLRDVLARAGISTVGAILSVPHDDDMPILRQKNAGRVTLREFREVQRALRGTVSADVVAACQPAAGPPVLDRIATALESIAASLARRTHE